MTYNYSLVVTVDPFADVVEFPDGIAVVELALVAGDVVAHLEFDVVIFDVTVELFVVSLLDGFIVVAIVVALLEFPLAAFVVLPVIAVEFDEAVEPAAGFDVAFEADIDEDAAVDRVVEVAGLLSVVVIDTGAVEDAELSVLVEFAAGELSPLFDVEGFVEADTVVEDAVVVVKPDDVLLFGRFAATVCWMKPIIDCTLT